MSNRAVNRGLWLSSCSGVIVSLGLASYFLLSSHTEWEALGAGIVGVGFLFLGPIAGFFISAIVAGLVYLPAYAISRRIIEFHVYLLPAIGAAVGLMAAFFLSTRSDNFLLDVYYLLVFWGVLGGFLFAYGARPEKPLQPKRKNRNE